MLDLSLGTLVAGVPSVLVALIGGYFLVRAKRTPQAPEQTPIERAWDENRLLAGEVRVLRDAFDALYSWVQRALQTWGMGSVPPFTDEEREAIVKVRNTPRLPERTGGEFLP